MKKYAIPTATYKYLPTAREILFDHIIKTIKEETQVQEEDVRGKLILIYEDGDTSKPENYRPITVLNAGYKILKATLTELISENLAD